MKIRLIKPLRVKPLEARGEAASINKKRYMVLKIKRFVISLIHLMLV